MGFVNFYDVSWLSDPVLQDIKAHFPAEGQPIDSDFLGHWKFVLLKLLKVLQCAEVGEKDDFICG
jgi:hypothetical protein